MRETSVLIALFLLILNSTASIPATGSATWVRNTKGQETLAWSLKTIQPPGEKSGKIEPEWFPSMDDR